MNSKLLLFFTGIIIVFSILARFLPHPANFTPIGALALFVGARVAQQNKWGLLLPLGAMLISDFFIGLYDWRIMAVVYASFFLYGIFGMAAGKSPSRVIRASLMGSAVFYLTTNAAVWAFSPMYEKTLSDLLLSYTLAVPFFKTMLLGDLFYAGMFFVAYEFARALLEKKVFVKQIA